LIAFDQAVRRVYHFRDEIMELIRTPEFMIHEWKELGILEGDCDDISTFNASVIRAMDIRSRFVCIRTNPSDSNFKHVFVEAFANNQWFRIDPTVSNATEFIYYGERMIQNV
jgi:transglutaminase-like putative cysteine protease